MLIFRNLRETWLVSCFEALFLRANRECRCYRGYVGQKNPDWISHAFYCLKPSQKSHKALMVGLWSGEGSPVEKQSFDFFQNVTRISNCFVYNISWVFLFFLLSVDKRNTDTLKALVRDKLFYLTVCHWGGRLVQIWMVQCCFVLSWMSVRIFQAENSKARDIIPEWQTVNPTKGQGESLGVRYRDGGDQEEAAGRMAPF